MATTDPVKMLKEIAAGYKQIADNINRIKVPKRSTWAKDLQKEFAALATQNKQLTETIGKMSLSVKALENDYREVNDELLQYKKASGESSQNTKKNSDAMKKESRAV